MSKSVAVPVAKLVLKAVDCTFGGVFVVGGQVSARSSTNDIGNT